MNDVLNGTFVPTAGVPMTREQKMQGRRHLVDALLQVYAQGQEKRLVWQGTRTDLVEALHLIYIYGDIRDEYGELEHFKRLVHHFFTLFDLKTPINPHALLRNASKRQVSFLDRYCWLLFEGREEKPLGKWMKTVD